MTARQTFTFVLLGAALLLACGGQSPSSVENWPGRDGPIVVFGDSLVSGSGAGPGEDFPSVLGNILGREVRNLGIPGATSEDLKGQVNRVHRESPRLVIVAVGGNDLIHQLAPEDTVANIRTTVTALRDEGAMVAVVGYKFGPGHWDLRKRCRTIAADLGAWYLDDPLDDLFDDPSYKSDRVHLNAAGYRIVAERIAEGVRPILE